MTAVKLSPGGQLTLPIEVQQALNLQSGSTLNLQVEGNVIHLIRSQSDGKELPPRTPGNWHITLSEDFDAPLPGFEDWR